MKRRRKLLITLVMAALRLCVCLGIGDSTPASAQKLVWAKKAGGTSADGGSGIAVDSSGNSYVVGYVDTVYSFFAKYDKDGNQLWFRQTSSPVWQDVAVDATGANVYVTGWFFGSASFGAGVFLNTSSVGTFVAKYDSAGNAVWARKADGTQEARGSSIAIDNALNSYITGSFGGAVTFGVGASQTTLTATAYYDTFIAKYDDHGDLVWANAAGGGTSSDESTGIDIAVDGSGDSCYVTGVFGAAAGMMAFPPLPIASTGISPGSWVAKCDSGGNFVWARQTAVLNYGGAAIGVDNLGNSYLAGPSLGFSVGPLGFETPVVAKYDDNGNRIWGRGVAYPGSFLTRSAGVAVDAAGNSYVTGIFSGTEDFGPIVPPMGSPTPPVLLTAAGSYDMFTAKYDTDGNLLWIRQAGATVGGYAYGKGIALDGAFNTYVAGFFVGTANFAGGVSLTSAGQDDIFLAKYEPAVLTASAITWASPQAVVYGTALDANQLNATASAPGTFAFSPPAGTVLDAGDHFLSVAFTPTDPSQYTSANGQVTLHVDPAPLIVTADDKTRAYGATAIFTGNIAGLVNNDNITQLFATPATQASPPGNYPIDSALVDPGNRLPNYVVQFVSGTLTITSGATHFAISAPASTVSGVPFLFTVTALDPLGSIDPGYGGIVHFTSSDGNTVLPFDSILTNGSATLSATLRTARNQTIIATDQSFASLTGTSNTINVSSGPATHFAFSGLPASSLAGTSINFTLTALDAWGNVATSFTGTVAFTSSDPSAVFCCFTPLSGGVGTFSVTLKAAGGRFLTATDTASPSIAGNSMSVTVAAGPVSRLLVLEPLFANAGVPFNLTVTAFDSFNNIANGYTGILHFTSSDVNAILPPDSALTNSRGSFAVVLNSAGRQTITATDTVASAITGTTFNGVNVSGSAAPTPTGGNVIVQPLDPATGVPQPISLTFSNVSASGGANAVQVPISSPANFSLNGVAYDITTTAQYTAPVTVCFTGSFTSSDVILHYENGAWAQLPNQKLLPPGAGPYTTLCADTNSLSPFGVFTPLPTASVITWPVPQPIVYGTALGANQLNATASVPGSFVFSPPAGTALDAGDHALAVTFTPADPVHYTSVSSQVTLHVDTAPLTVTADDKVRTYGSTTVFTGFLAGLVNIDNITASYATTATPASHPGNYSITPSLIDPNNRRSNYSVQLVSGTLTVNKATSVVAWSNPAGIAFGSALGSGQLNATASTPGTFVYTPPAGTVLPAGNGQVLAAAFTPADTVDYAAAAATVTINVVSAPQSAANLVVTKVLSRSGGNIVVQLTIANTGGTAAANVTLSSLKIGSTSGAPLPMVLGTIAGGASVQATVTVPGSAGSSGAASTLALSGTYAGGAFSSNARITLP